MDCGEKFYKEFFDKNFGDDKKREILDEKNKKIPDLFKYTNLNHIEDLLCENLMYLSSLEDLNDPYEGVITHNIYEILYNNLKPINVYRKNINCEELQENLHKSFSDIFEIICGDFFSRDYSIRTDRGLNVSFDDSSFRDLTNEIKKTNFILSFSTNCHNNPLWAHYADNHKGVCIQYDIKNNAKKFIFDNCFPVFYDDSNFSNEITSLDNIKDELILKPLLKKGTDWSYEREWRIVLNLNELIDKNEFFCSYNGNYIRFLKPVAVYMGKEISDEDEKKIKRICQCMDIKLFKMKFNDSSYKLSHYSV